MYKHPFFDIRSLFYKPSKDFLPENNRARQAHGATRRNRYHLAMFFKRFRKYQNSSVLSGSIKRWMQLAFRIMTWAALYRAKRIISCIFSLDIQHRHTYGDTNHGPESLFLDGLGRFLLDTLTIVMVFFVVDGLSQGVLTGKKKNRRAASYLLDR